MAGAQAVDLAKPGRIGTALERALRAVRNHCPFLDEDRPVGDEIARIADDLIATGDLARIVGAQA